MTGRELPPTSRFATDDGAADPALAAALARRTSNGPLTDVVAALAAARVLVPVLAVEEDESTRESGCAPPAEAFAEARHASAGVVAVATPDGRTALPVFSSVAALAAWNPSARPMPAEGPRAAAAALSEGWDLLVVDPGDERATIVPRPAVHALATGRSWQPAVWDGQVMPAVRDAVRRAASGPGVLGVEVAPGGRAEVTVVLTLVAGLSRVTLEGLLGDVGARLAADPEVTAAVDSLELRPLRRPADGTSAAPGGDGQGSVLSDGGDATPGRGREGRWRRLPGRR